MASTIDTADRDCAGLSTSASVTEVILVLSIIEESIAFARDPADEQPGHAER
jgi:hypothetical protein